MKIKIIDKSEMLGEGEKGEKVKENKIREVGKEKKIKLISENIMIHEEVYCERMKKGLLNNCSICQNINSDIFIKCPIKFK